MRFTDYIKETEENTDQLEKGIEVEKEHKDLLDLIKEKLKEHNHGCEMPITDDEFYSTIAKAHLKELPDYYDRLEKMEDKNTEE